MGGLGTTEILLIAVVVLVLFGAKKLPEIGKSLGKGLREFKKATNEITSPLQEGMDEMTSKDVIDHEPISSVEKNEAKKDEKPQEKKVPAEDKKA